MNNRLRGTGWFIVFAGMLAGCQSQVRQASRAANMVRDVSRSSEARFSIIGEEIATPRPDATLIASEAAAGIVEQRRIQTLAGGIQETLTETEDRPSPWISVLNLWGWIALLGMTLFVLTYFGIAPALRRVLRRRLVTK